VANGKVTRKVKKKIRRNYFLGSFVYKIAMWQESTWHKHESKVMWHGYDLG
jgi:hypothetical protein